MELIRTNPALRAILAGRLVSTAGTWLAYIALVATVYDRTHSSRWVAVLLMAEFAPSVAVAAVAGVIDRLPRKLLLVGAELTGCTVFAALPFVHEPVAIVALAVVAGTAGAVFQPALMAAIPNLVSADDLPRAMGLCQTMATTGMAAGPALAGMLVGAFGTGAAFGFNAGSFALSAAVLTTIPRGSLQAESAYEGSVWRGVGEALSLVRSSSLLRTVFWTSGIAVVAAAAVNVGEVFLARDTFAAGTVGFGVLATGLGIGLVGGSARSGTVVSRLGGAEAYRLGLWLTAGSLAAAALSPNVWTAACCAVGAGAGNAFFLAGRANVVQTSVADAMRGRAFALLYASGDASMVLGMVGAGVAIELVGARGVWLAAAVVFTIAALAARAHRALLPVPAST